MFKVDSAAVKVAAEKFGASAGHLAVAAEYHEAPSQMDFFDKGLIRKLEDTHRAFASLLQSRLDGAAAALRESADELSKVAAFYVETDVAAAARVDATLPAIERSDRDPWSGR